MNAEIKQSDSARTDQRTKCFRPLDELHQLLMRRDIAGAREEIARLLESDEDEPTMGMDGGFDWIPNPVFEVADQIRRALQFLNDGLIGNAEAEIASLMFTR